MKKTILIIIFILLIAGCSKTTVKNNNPSLKKSSDASSSEPLESNSNNLITPRAIGRANSGQILIIPEDSEKIEQLGAPSCLGEETDYSFKGKYKILFKDTENNVTQISDYDGQIIAKDKTVKYLSSSPKTIPEVIDNMLVMSTWEPEEGNYKEFFRPDIKNKK